MIKLEIDNSYSRIIGLSPKQEAAFRDVLSYIVGGSSAFFSGYGVRKKSLLSKRGEFPTGLASRIVSKLCNEKLDFDIKDLRTIPTSNIPKPMLEKAYKWQKEALAAAIHNGRGTISAPTGTGKSRAIAMIAAFFNLKTLVVCPSLEIKRQLSETLKDFPNVRVENIDSKKLLKLTDFDMLILDEVHHAASKTYQKLNKSTWRGIYHRFCFSATPFRNDSEEQLLYEAIAGQIIYKLDYKEAIKNNYIVPIEAYYLEIPKQTTDAYSWAEVYSQLVVNNEIRNDQIALLLLRLQSNKIPTLCLVKEVSHGRMLSKTTNLPFVSGSDDESRDYINLFNRGEIKVLIGTTGILGEGVDTKPCEFVIIAGLGKAKSQFMQQVGRAVRTYPGKESAKIVLIRDSSHKFLLRHFNVQKKILLDEYGIKLIKL